MTTRYSVGAAYDSCSFVLAVVVTAACLVVGGIMYLYGSPTGTTVLAAGGAGAAVSVVMALVTSSRRKYLCLAREGFSVTDRFGPKDYSFDDVRGLSCTVTPDFESGVQKSVTYHVKVWLDAPDLTAPLSFDHKAALEGMDETETWVQAFQNHFLERAHADLGADRGVQGDGWELHRNELRLGGEPPQAVRTRDVQTADIYDGQVCVWKAGQDEPVCRFPLDGRNTWMLTQLLRELAPERPEGEEPPAGSLGRVLFERGTEPNHKSLLLIPAGLLVVGGGVMLIMAGSTGWGIAVIVVGVIMFFAGMPSTLFRCHEWGVREVRLTGEQVLRYGDMESFSYRGVRHFLNGSYQGTDFNFVFVPRAGAGEKPIAYSTRLQGIDQELEILRDHISKVIANRMAQDLQAGRPVRWTPRMRLLPDGIEHTPSGFLGDKAPATIPFGDVANFELDQGVFHLWVRGNEKSVIQENVSEPNFFPGFHLLNVIFSPDEENQEESENADED